MKQMLSSIPYWLTHFRPFLFRGIKKKARSHLFVHVGVGRVHHPHSWLTRFGQCRRIKRLNSSKENKTTEKKNISDIYEDLYGLPLTKIGSASTRYRTNLWKFEEKIMPGFLKTQFRSFWMRLQACPSG